MKAYGRSHTRKDTKKPKDKDMEKIKSKPGMSNAGEYEGFVTAGPHGTYPLGYSKGTISPKRVRAALALAHHLGKAGENKLRKNIARILTQKHKLPSLVARIRKGQ